MSIINAASTSKADVTTAIGLAADGDTVVIPAGGPTSWTGAGISTSKGIKIQGAGAPKVIAVSRSTLTLGSGSKSLTIISTSLTGSPPAPISNTLIPITNGQTLRIVELGFRANFMEGTVTSYSAGSLVMNITSFGGTIGTSGPANTMNSNGKRWIVQTVPASQTIITNDLSANNFMFTLTEHASISINVNGIKFATGTGTDVSFYIARTSGGKPILIHDCFMESHGGSGGFAGGGPQIDGNTSRGIIWNNSFECSPAGQSDAAVIRTKDAAGSAMPNSWTTVSTMGTADSDGTNNLYFEDNTIHAYLQGYVDFDDMSRTVIRNNVLDNSGGASHGADTSNIGLRHFEIYRNYGIFDSYGDGSSGNMNWWNLIRGGAGVIYDNVLPDITSTDWGDKADITLAQENLARNAGPHAGWGHGGTPGQFYPCPRQTGFGRVTGAGSCSGPQVSSPTTFGPASTDSQTYVGDSEPIYIWNNRRTSGGGTTALQIGYATAYTDIVDADAQENYIVLDRDYFNGAGTAKPGYSPYQYPHPLRDDSPPVNGGGTQLLLMGEGLT